MTAPSCLMPTEFDRRDKIREHYEWWVTLREADGTMRGCSVFETTSKWAAVFIARGQERGFYPGAIVSIERKCGAYLQGAGARAVSRRDCFD